jgi:hypothetical protein
LNETLDGVTEQNQKFIYDAISKQTAESFYDTRNQKLHGIFLKPATKGSSTLKKSNKNSSSYSSFISHKLDSHHHLIAQWLPF